MDVDDDEDDDDDDEEEDDDDEDDEAAAAAEARALLESLPAQVGCRAFDRPCPSWQWRILSHNMLQQI